MLRGEAAAAAAGEAAAAELSLGAPLSLLHAGGVGARLPEAVVTKGWGSAALASGLHSYSRSPGHST